MNKKEIIKKLKELEKPVLYIKDMSEIFKKKDCKKMMEYIFIDDIIKNINFIKEELKLITEDLKN